MTFRIQVDVLDCLGCGNCADNCPAADFIMEDIRQKVESVEGVTAATINLVFEPEWDKDMMSEEAKLELGFL